MKIFHWASLLRVEDIAWSISSISIINGICTGRDIFVNVKRFTNLIVSYKKDASVHFKDHN